MKVNLKKQSMSAVLKALWRKTPRASGYNRAPFNQLQEIEAVLNFLNIQLRKIRRKHFQKYLEGYAPMLTSRDAEKYVDGEDEVIDFETIIKLHYYATNG